MRLFKFLIFSEIFLLFPPISDHLQQNWCSKNPKGSPLLHFSALCDLSETSNFKKKFEKNFRIFFSQFLVFWELLLSPVVEKVVFESSWALDMAPTWAVPGMFLMRRLFFSDVFGNFVWRYPSKRTVASSESITFLNFLMWIGELHRDIVLQKLILTICVDKLWNWKTRNAFQIAYGWNKWFQNCNFNWQSKIRKLKTCFGKLPSCESCEILTCTVFAGDLVVCFDICFMIFSTF